MDGKLIKQVLKQNNLDAYLIYDFRGSNFLGREILGFNKHTTRRFISILSTRENIHIVPKMESLQFSHLDGKKVEYTTHEEFQNFLKKHISKYKNIAIDYSNNNDLPIIDNIPSGVHDLLKKVHPNGKFVSSADFSQQLSATWGEKGYKSHKKAAKKLKPIFDYVFETVSSELSAGNEIREFDLMQDVIKKFKNKGLHNDEENICIIANGTRTNNPHYFPTKEKNYLIKPNSPLLVDIWAREKDGVYADYTLYGWIGPKPVDETVQDAWDTFVKASDAGISFLEKNVKKGVKGFEVDNIVRGVIAERGYSKYLLHRSGHSLGKKEHGNGANIDDFETHDNRKILPDTGLTLEPGIYLPKYGVRGEVDIYIHPDFEVEVTTFKQNDLIIV